MDFIPKLKEFISKKEALNLSSLSLAYVGDSVHMLYIRSKTVCEMNAKISKENSEVIKMVNAKAQSEAMAIYSLLNEDEVEIYKRARNAHVHTKAKSASLADYMQATAFEAVVGYLYLTGQEDRLKELLEQTL